jgi:hypothetical protein
LPPANSETGEPHTLVSGPVELVEQAVQVGRTSALDARFERLVPWIDAQRHVWIVLAPSALTNDEGQWLLSGRLASLRRPLAALLDPEITAVALSLHVDEMTYLELVVQHSVDVRGDELGQRLWDRLAAARTTAVDRVGALSAGEYWRGVQIRFDNMIAELFRHLRWGVEEDNVLLNAWLPAPAAHNLLAASELALAAAQGSPTATVSSSAPQSLAALMQVPRSIAINTRPDLINALSGLEAEIELDFPDLLFDMTIRVVREALSKEGITQNQRIGVIDRQNVPLGDILTEMLFSANPDKNATDPRDPRCKLVWVIAPDPEGSPGEVILVTTRADAEAKGYTLPEAFQPRMEERP